MKRIVFIFTLIMVNFVYAFCGGIQDKELVNVQKIELGHFDEIEIQYRSEQVVIFNNNSDELILKEYMTHNNSGYYAKITNSGNKLLIEAGQRPVGINMFRVKIEVYVPASHKNITIRTSSGAIEGNDEYTASTINIESTSGKIAVNSIIAGTVNLKATSGSIRCKKVNGNIGVRTSSGSIVLGSINGNVSAEASSGSIEMESVNGAIDAKTASGGIRCTAAENAGDISITSSSGSVVLNLPRNFPFNFSSKTSSGSLRTPFPDRLFSPVSDRKLIQGVIDNDNTSRNQIENNINIMTGSGSIRINWID